MTRMLFQSACVFCLAATGFSICFGADAKTLIDQAYQLTNEAKSIEDYTEVIRLCGEAEQANPAKEQVEYVKSLLAWSHNRRGEVFTEHATQAHESGQVEQARKLDGQALADFESSLQYDSKRWKTWHNRAVSRAIAGKYEEAIADFGKVIEMKPDYANARFNRGEILYDLGKLKEAIEDYTAAIRLNTTDAGAYASRAHSYFRVGQGRCCTH